VSARSTSPLDAELARVRAEGEELLRERGTWALHGDAYRSGGKFLRARLVLLAHFHAGETGGRTDLARARRAALAIELAHLGTLYHDDVVDRSPMRRGIPAVHVRLGIRAAALGGAHLLCLANALAAELPEPLGRRWGQAALHVANGQLRETESSGDLELDPETYVRTVARKTAALFELAASFGALLAEAPQDQRQGLLVFARHLGIAFQLFDDLYDFTTQPEHHRPPGNDLRERVYTLPVLYGVRDPQASSSLRDLLRNDGHPLDENRAHRAQEILLSCGAFDRAYRRTLQEREAAAHALDGLDPSSAVDGLSSLLESVESRVPTSAARASS